MPHIYVKIDMSTVGIQSWLEKHVADIHEAMADSTAYAPIDIALFIEPFHPKQAYNAMPVEFIFEMGTQHKQGCEAVARRCVRALVELGLDEVVQEAVDEDWGVWVKSGGNAGFCSCTQWYDSH